MDGEPWHRTDAAADAAAGVTGSITTNSNGIGGIRPESSTQVQTMESSGGGSGGGVRKTQASASIEKLLGTTKLTSGVDGPGTTPVFLQNPDGSFLEGVPPGYKEKTPPRSPRSMMLTDPTLLQFGDEWDIMNASMAEEFDYIYSRHQQLFMCLLMMQFLVEVAYNVVFVYNGRRAIADVYRLYESTVKMRTLEITFWSMFVADLLYGIAYYVLGAAAIWTNRPRVYKTFVTWCLVGIASQVLLAYINKFNLLVFFLRLLAYIYAKFLRNLALRMSFLPQPLGSVNSGVPSEQASDTETI